MTGTVSVAPPLRKTVSIVIKSISVFPAANRQQHGCFKVIRVESGFNSYNAVQFATRSFAACDRFGNIGRPNSL